MRLAAVFFGAFAITFAAGAQTFSLHIETVSGQTQFRIGEAIGLKGTLESMGIADTGPPGWMIMVNGARTVLSIGRDRFVVSPETGTRDPWEYRLHGPIVYSGPAGMMLGNKPVALNIDLNQWVRFESAGHYGAHARFVVSGPQQQNVVVESNPIEFDIVPADPEWQARELASDIAILNSTSTNDNLAFQARMSAAYRIAYLDTPAAVHEMAARLGTADIQTAQIFADGLLSSRHGAEAIAAMRELLRSSAEPVTPIFLRTLAGLDKSGPAPGGVLAGVIEQKQGAAKAISIETLLENMPADRVPANMRSEIATLFPELPEARQRELLSSQWEKIAGPEMIPVLRDIYENAPSDAAAPSRFVWDSLLASAVERLYGLDPAGTRPLLIDEIRRTQPRLPYHTLAMLPDATLPELDSVLLSRLQHGGGRPAEEMIARYSTNSILAAVKDFYSRRDAEMKSRVTANPNIAAPVCEPPLLAYFLRVDPAWGEKAFRQSLAERRYGTGRCWLVVVGETAVYNSGPAWEKIAIGALRDPSVPVKIDAVESLARYGSPASKAAIFEAFRYWHEWWADRGEPNDENRRLEYAFVEATTRPGNWKPSDADLAAIRDLCLTPGCKSQVPLASSDQFSR